MLVYAVEGLGFRVCLGSAAATNSVQCIVGAHNPWPAPSFMQPHAQPIPACAEFTSELCGETWVVKDGTVTALLKGVRIQGQGEEHSEQVQAQLAEALKEKAKLKSEKAVALAEKKAKKEEERRRKFAKKVLVSFPSLIFSRD